MRDEGRTALTASGLVAATTNGSDLPERPMVVFFADGYADFTGGADEMSTRGLVSTL